MTTSEIARYDRQMTIDYEREYMITLFDDHTHNKASTELSSALSYFHILLNGYFIIATASGYGLVNEGEITMNNYLITLMARGGVFLLSWIAFFLVYFNHEARIQANTIYGILSTIFVFYSLGTDARNLPYFTGEANEGYAVNNIIVLIVYLLFFREVVFFRYCLMVFLSLLSMLTYIVLFAFTGAIDTPIMIGEFLLLIGALVLLCSDSYS